MYHMRVGDPAIWGDGDGWGRPPMPDPSKPHTSTPLQPPAMQCSTSHALGVRGPHGLSATHAALTIDLVL